MKKIQINILAHLYREQFFVYILYYLLKIKKENKEQIKIVIHNTVDLQYWKDVVDILNKNEIEAEKVPTTSGNYMHKIEKAILTSSKYSCSMDDDILLNNHLWDYMIENIDILDDDKNLFFAPLISNGIPSVDLFIEDFMNEEEKKIMWSVFTNTQIENMWGVNYESLNDHTVKAEKWNPDNFYNEVSKIDHYYKGIHPVRPSKEAHEKLFEIITNNYPKFEEKGNYSINKIKMPYFCNSFYFIKSKTWHEIISDKSLFRDGFDEVPMNLYMEKHDLNMIFVKNGYCIHMAYNTIGHWQRLIEKSYVDKLSTLIK